MTRFGYISVNNENTINLSHLSDLKNSFKDEILRNNLEIGDKCERNI